MPRAIFLSLLVGILALLYIGNIFSCTVAIAALKLDFEVLFFKYSSSLRIIKENKTSRLDGNLLEWMHLSPNVGTEPRKYWRGSLYLLAINVLNF